MPLPDLRDLTIPSDDLSHTEQSELVKTAIQEDLMYNTYMQRTGYNPISTYDVPRANAVPPIPSSASEYLPLLPTPAAVAPVGQPTFYNQQIPVALSMQQTFDESCHISADQIDNFVREKNYMHALPLTTHAYIQLGNSFFTDLAPSHVLPGPGDPRTLKDL